MVEPVQFYSDKEKRIISPMLFSSVAEAWAEEVHKKGGRDSNKRSQLRKFYDEVLRLNMLVKVQKEDWNNILPFVNMLVAKAVYAKGRNKVTEEFVQLMKSCISQIQRKEDLDVFANFFEAFMGFYRKYGAN